MKGTKTKRLQDKSRTVLGYHVRRGGAHRLVVEKSGPVKRRSDAFSVRVDVEQESGGSLSGELVVKEIIPNDPTAYRKFHKRLDRLIERAG